MDSIHNSTNLYQNWMNQDFEQKSCYLNTRRSSIRNIIATSAQEHGSSKATQSKK
jgi:hypothetical protein